MPKTPLSRAPTDGPPPRAEQAAWRRNLLLIILLLALWACAAFVPSYFAREWTGQILGWPFSFWMAAYGSPLAFLAIVGVYAWLMNRKPRRP
ncbi:DUF4212 domain-containing protein [Orrella sp. JC864]|uniref:DUF4212 domain-containing protein n=1 Tax=Orrella sp. JC864 TaxID=3120298 RepID=UPI0012BC1B81